MIIILKPSATEENVAHIVEKATSLGLTANISRGVERTVIGFIGPEDVLRSTPLEAFPGVDRVMEVLAPYRLVSREFHPENSVITIKDDITIGGEQLAVMAGPCSIESYDSLLKIGQAVKASGSTILRGGAFKPRTSPYDFQGLGEEGLKILQDVGGQLGMATVTEVMDPREVELVHQYTDIFQLGARNMQNYGLLREVGQTHKPVLLKRGLSSTIKEWLMSAEYIASKGNMNIIFCERGVRTFETETRNTLDINAVAVIKKLSHLPIIVDPSHGTGKWGYVTAGARAGVAAGADGLMVEVHDKPEEAMSDGAQSLIPSNFDTLMTECRAIAQAVGRKM